MFESEVNKENQLSAESKPKKKVSEKETVKKNIKPRVNVRTNRAVELLKKKKEQDLNESNKSVDNLQFDHLKISSPLKNQSKNSEKNDISPKTKPSLNEKPKITKKNMGVKNIEKKKPLANKNDLNVSTPLSPFLKINISLNRSVLSPKVQDPKSRPKRNVRKPKTESPNHKITDYYQVRKSARNLKKDSVNKVFEELVNKILNHCEDGLEIKVFEDKGRGIVTTKQFFKGDFVLEYVGDLIDKDTAAEREEEYSKNQNVGCYMYYFKHKDVQHCVDATAESGKYGRLINHSRKGANLISKIIEVNMMPHLVFFAKTDIPIGTELLYDYGDRNKNSIQNHPWLTK